MKEGKLVVKLGLDKFKLSDDEVKNTILKRASLIPNNSKKFDEDKQAQDEMNEFLAEMEKLRELTNTPIEELIKIAHGLCVHPGMDIKQASEHIKSAVMLANAGYQAGMTVEDVSSNVRNDSNSFASIGLTTDEVLKNLKIMCKRLRRKKGKQKVNMRKAKFKGVS